MKNCIRKHWFREKIFSPKIRPVLTHPQSFSQLFSPVLPLSRVLMKEAFLSEIMLLDAIFYADSEYHMYFT
jgi:hypothetical protein